MLKIEKHIKNLEEKKFHKFIIGAALKDYQAIKDYSYYFTHAGADVIDISAFPHSVLCAKEGINKALKEDSSLEEPLIMVSVNIGEDPHFRRIEVNWDNCTHCLACVPSCPSGAFEAQGSRLKESLSPNLEPRTNQQSSLNYSADLCFGCSNCLPSCDFDALSFENWLAFEPESLVKLQKLGARSLEIHLNNDLEAFKSFYKKAPEFELESFCIGSEQMNKKDLEKATYTIINSVKNKKQKPFIIQTDGVPLSGARDLAIEKDLISMQNAKVVGEYIKEKFPKYQKKIYLQLAGGITEKSFQKARLQGLDINGVAIGSYARKILKTSKDPIKKAKELIKISSI